MQLVRPFDASQVNPEQGVGQLSVGKHPVVIKDSTIKGTKDNNGGYLQLDLEVQDGPNKGETGAYRLNLYNSSAEAVSIAEKQFSAVCHVCNVMQITDSVQLHNIPFVVEVTMQKGSDKYTEVKRVFDMQGNEPGKGQPAPATTAAPAANPWGGSQPAQPEQAPAQPAQSGWGQAPAQSAPEQAPAAPTGMPPWATKQ